MTAYAPKQYVVILLTVKLTAGSRLRGCYVPFKDEDSGVTDEQRVVIDEYKNTKVYTNCPP